VPARPPCGAPQLPHPQQQHLSQQPEHAQAQQPGLPSVAAVLTASTLPAGHWATSVLFAGGLQPALLEALAASAAPPEPRRAPAAPMAAFGIPLLLPAPAPATDAPDADRAFVRELLSPARGPRRGPQRPRRAARGHGARRCRWPRGLDGLGRATAAATLWAAGLAPLARAAAAAVAAAGGVVPEGHVTLTLAPGTQPLGTPETSAGRRRCPTLHGLDSRAALQDGCCGGQAEGWAGLPPARVSAAAGGSDCPRRDSRWQAQLLLLRLPRPLPLRRLPPPLPLLQRRAAGKVTVTDYAGIAGVLSAAALFAPRRCASCC